MRNLTLMTVVVLLGLLAATVLGCNGGAGAVVETRPLSPDALVGRLETVGVWPVYGAKVDLHPMGVRGDGTTTLMGGDITLYPTKGATEGGVIAYATLYSRTYLAQYHCQSRAKRCVSIEQWSVVLGHSEDDTHPVWQKVYSKLGR